MKANVGHQMATILLNYLWPLRLRKHARQTSQFTPMPLRSHLLRFNERPDFFGVGRSVEYAAVDGGDDE